MINITKVRNTAHGLKKFLIQRLKNSKVVKKVTCKKDNVQVDRVSYDVSVHVNTAWPIIIPISQYDLPRGIIFPPYDYRFPKLKATKKIRWEVDRHDGMVGRKGKDRGICTGDWLERVVVAVNNAIRFSQRYPENSFNPNDFVLELHDGDDNVVE